MREMPQMPQSIQKIPTPVRGLLRLVLQALARLGGDTRMGVGHDKSMREVSDVCVICVKPFVHG